MAPRGRPQKHCCSKCNKSFRSGNALGGHMSCHWRIDKKTKSTSSSPSVVNQQVSLLSSCDDKHLLLSPETQCQMCSKVFSTSKSLGEHMGMHDEKKVDANPEEEVVGLMEALAIAVGMKNVKVFSSVKRKRSFRSKRHTPTLSLKERDAADALLMLSESFDKTSAYEDCYLGNKEDNSLASIVLMEDNMNAPDRSLVRSVDSKGPKNDNNSANEICYESDKESCLVPVISKEDMDLNNFNHELVGDVEPRGPRTDNSEEEVKFSDHSAAVKAKSHRCNSCGKSFRSGQALGGHMRRHYVPKCNGHK
ncbi:hypothetical protein GUJ93_ZPchr0012g19793 [Zizania palustris]|uniref:C2H2-type domain-containing protein n=1 Tax=Zizania palustris TaxID=103762 RepID=A0A8J5WKN9_ZIZPA|nr:hypothetical protein GUJ93_ZPchr0012g19793 [Zizania palustris]